MPDSLRRVTVLLSGSGTTFAAINAFAQRVNAPFAVTDVVSDQPDAYGLQRAADAGCRTHTVNYRDFDSRDKFDAELLDVTLSTAPDLVVLAGFMRIVAPDFVRTFEGKLLNIHPSLLPDYPGLNTYQRALEANESEHGTTVHFVNDVLDGGPLIAQAVVGILDDDTPRSLAARVQQAERTLYPSVIDWFAQGRLRLQDGDVWLDDRRLDRPLRGTINADTHEYERHE